MRDFIKSALLADIFAEFSYICKMWVKVLTAKQALALFARPKLARL